MTLREFIQTFENRDQLAAFIMLQGGHSFNNFLCFETEAESVHFCYATTYHYLTADARHMDKQDLLHGAWKLNGVRWPILDQDMDSLDISVF